MTVLKRETLVTQGVTAIEKRKAIKPPPGLAETRRAGMLGRVNQSHLTPDTVGSMMGRPELVIPTLDRKSLAILRIADGIKELRRIPLPGRVERGVAALGSGPDTHILAALEDGRVVLVRP